MSIKEYSLDRFEQWNIQFCPTGILRIYTQLGDTFIIQAII